MFKVPAAPQGRSPLYLTVSATNVGSASSCANRIWHAKPLSSSEVKVLLLDAPRANQLPGKAYIAFPMSYVHGMISILSHNHRACCDERG